MTPLCLAQLRQQLWVLLHDFLIILLVSLTYLMVLGRFRYLFLPFLR